MSEVYNPETVLFAKLEALVLEARELAGKLEPASPDDRPILERQLTELEEQIERLRTRLRERG